MRSTRCLVWLALSCGLVLLPACKSSSEKPKPEGNYGKYALYGTKYDDVDQAKAKANADDMLTQLQDEPKVCLIGLWAYNPPALLSAVKAAKKEGKVQIVGFDEDENTLLGIKDGNIHGSIVQQPFEFGYQSVKLMAELIKAPDTKLPADGVMHIPYKVIKKDQADAFRDHLKELKKSAAGDNEVKSDVKVLFVSNNNAEFWTYAQAGAYKAGKDFNVEVIFRKPQHPTAAEQKRIIDEQLGGVKGVALSVIDPKNQKDFLNEIADKAILLTVDNDAPDTKRKCYIGTDNYAAGKEAGKLVKEAMPDGGAIGIFVGQPDPINARQRRQGVLDELAGQKDANGK